MMRCPNDNTELRIADRQGIEIDYCPECRGVWLDRGELDKMIERSMTFAPGVGVRSEQPQGYPQQPAREYHRYDDERYDDEREGYPGDYGKRDDYDRGYDPRKRKRGGFLEELFDFD